MNYIRHTQQVNIIRKPIEKFFYGNIFDYDKTISVKNNEWLEKFLTIKKIYLHDDLNDFIVINYINLSNYVSELYQKIQNQVTTISMPIEGLSIEGIRRHFNTSGTSGSAGILSKF